MRSTKQANWLPLQNNNGRDHKDGASQMSSTERLQQAAQLRECGDETRGDIDANDSRIGLRNIAPVLLFVFSDDSFYRVEIDS